jgi:peptidoglycan/LPS O-acetylase OafA/YrhL
MTPGGRRAHHDSVTSGGSHGGRWPELDGLRGIAIALVLICHWLWMGADALRFTAVGAAGVTVFFTLSGYLITTQLVGEHRATGRVSLRAFYVRRVRRLAPALLALLGFLAVLQALSGARLAPLLPTALLYANWKAAAGTTLGVLSPTWSLSIEEQFYLLWPLVLLLALRSRRGALVVTVAGIVLSTTLRFWLAGGLHDDLRVYYGTDTQAASLLVGCLLALLMSSGLPVVRLPPWVVTAVAASLFAWVLVPSAAVGSVVVPTVVPWAAAFLIWACAGTSVGWLASRPLRHLGRRSYGIYLWHYPLVLVVASATDGSVVWCLVAVGASLGIAEISWRTVERPFLVPRTRRPLVPAGVASMLGRARRVVVARPADATSS